MLFLSKKRKSIGPAQRPHPVGWTIIPAAGRRGRRPLQARSGPGGGPTAGGAVPGRNRRLLPAWAANEPPARLLNASRPAPTNRIRRRIRNVGEQLAAPAFPGSTRPRAIRKSPLRANTYARQRSNGGPSGRQPLQGKPNVSSHFDSSQTCEKSFLPQPSQTYR